MSSKKIVIIGGGHNGLVAAAYLAKAGHKVTVLESRHQVGGAASTDTDTFPGFKISTASYLNSLFSSQIVRDLDLKRFGYEMLPREPSSFTPVPGSTKSLLLGKDTAFNQAQIAQFSKRDAEMYPRYEHELGKIAEWVAAMMPMIPPSGPLPRKMSDIQSMFAFAHHVLRMIATPRRMYGLCKLLLTDPVKYLDSWFESDVLKATLITDALIGTTKLSGYVLLHHVMGDAGSARGIWGYMRGSMGGISNALATACKELGVEIICDAHARRITLIRTKTVSLVIANIRDSRCEIVTPRIFPADIVVSTINPTTTFTKLLEGVHAVDDIRKKVVARDCESASTKVNLTLSGLPNFRAMPGTIPGPQHQGTIHIAPSVAYILEALRDYQEGRSSLRPILEITIPSVVDDTLAPKGRHVMNIFLQFVKKGEDGQKYFRDVILPLMREYISNIDEIITGVQILTPQDLEREFGMVGGNIFHGGMGLKQLWWNRPAPGIADYRTPIKGFYLSGAGTHPGGGVCGYPGSNTARVILEDLGYRNS